MRNCERTSRSGDLTVVEARTMRADHVMEALNARARKDRAYTTYMTIMARLDSKGLLERARQGKTDFYRAVYTRDRYADLRAQAEVDSIVDQFGKLALGHFARQMAQLDPQRRRALQRLARKK